MAKIRFLMACSMVFLLPPDLLADIGDRLLTIGPNGTPPGFGFSVDVYDGRFIVGSARPQLDQFHDTVDIYDSDTGEVISTLFSEDAELGFGRSVALGAERAIVGAVHLSSSNETGDDLGTAHIFDIQTGAEIMTLRPNDARPGQGFGTSVAVAEDLNLALVGASRDDELRFNGGAVYLFDLTTGEQLHKLTTPQEHANRGLWTLLGAEIAVDGNLAAFGELNSEVPEGGTTRGSVQLFDLSSLQFLQKITVPESPGRYHDLFGSGLDLDGSRLVVGAPGLEGNSGKAYVFDTTTGEPTMTLSPEVTQSYQQFGSDIALQGDVVVVTSWNRSRSVSLFNATSGEQLDRLTDRLEFEMRGANDQVAIDDGLIVVGSPFDHSIHVIDGVLAGDFNHDGFIDVIDLDQLFAAIRGVNTDIRFDVDEDKEVTIDDATFWIREIKNTFFGDANLDGRFDTKDFILVFQAGEFEDNIALNSSWSTGDWNGDGEFNSRDFVVALQDTGFEAGPRVEQSVVPEPNCVWPLSMLLVSHYLRIRNKGLWRFNRQHPDS